jgi:hypothetical protein
MAKMTYPIVAPNIARCKQVAKILRTLDLPRRLISQPIFSTDRRLVGNFNLLLIAICHQTQDLSGIADGKWRRGWDYLERRLNEHCRRNQDFLKVDNWPSLSCRELHEALASPQVGSAFSDIKARTFLINDLGCCMRRSQYESFEQLYDATERRCRGDNSIFSFLRDTEAYSDPNEKKARLLVGVLRDAHGWEFEDSRKLGPPVDYHEIRGHLRIGTVSVSDKGLSARIQSNNVAEHEDHLFRAAVSDAVIAIAGELPNLDALQVHYVLWNYFRALCRRDKPVCKKEGELSANELDPAYFELFERTARGGNCMFKSVCDSARTGVFPVVEYIYGGSYY